MTRVEALEAAEKLVDRIDPKKNDRGYDRTTADISARVAAVLRIAEWLTTETPEPNSDMRRWAESAA